ncbi:MAG: mucin desulfatase, partial [Clostridia bacterium]|nr:mucin desulfatase [Clostridia bacterium]
MTREELCSKRDEALEAFGIIDRATYCEPYGNGHINDTFLVVCQCGKRYILQRINHQIFKKPQEIMENICAVTSFIRQKAIADGGDAERCTLSVVKTRSGESFYEDSIGSPMSEGDRLWCSDCGAEWRLDEKYVLTGPVFDHINAW